ncbi:phosphopantothenoylcysteine decarboxylase/phosphopantothenate-cysteine ligase [Peptoanaerobacter stomatis]|uniref:Coenzyme A biosynthesis bifunctional protein CoaBC n=1 Tax=Peptoanaerobacter stomatis TaxID=796937 RepID=G9XET5_9FIRM|nr:bifunctional phosphopantothenoylcysteine decarboxylase/phosphopantothenate--cysteine ligase CoaBC [Peptoanaerobacter stomatis]EHL17915.1 phosphopantothenoylcysteine decarboxylase/phosphopantothenate-cysteine ligase [Peptoanaerobacter stomatis]
MKNIVLGVTGSIAAYKACDITSKLVKKYINIDVIMTNNAVKFVNPLTFQTLSSNVVNVDMFQDIKYWEVNHIELAKKADILLIAPATANIIAKIANGIADDMLSSVALATKSKIIIAPAMNTNMYDNPATTENIEKLKKRGVLFIEPCSGVLACKDIGKGKLADVETIIDVVDFELNKTQELEGKNILVTAGATIEDIDPVRYITNNSSGKMGYAIAKESALMGANVTLISGHTNLSVPYGIKEFVKIRSAKDMYDEVINRYNDADIVIKAAAVADYMPQRKEDNKIKKSDTDMSIALTRTKDILKTLGENKKHQILVGFAAETTDVENYAKTKIQKKNLDMIVANNVSMEGAGFLSDTNIVDIYFSDGTKTHIAKSSKCEIAKLVLKNIKEKFVK